MLTMLVLGVAMTGLQVAAALPWLLALDVGLRGVILRALKGLPFHAAWIGAGLGFGLLLEQQSDMSWGRVYGSLLHLQLTADFFVAAFGLLLGLWPKGGAVALAAFRESIRQPMYWLLTSLGLIALAVSPILPYFTFERMEELKMVKELGYAFIMLFPAVFAVLAASLSISEEIEGRTAVTLMSKPISRRQFLLGKFGGVLLAALFMAVLLAWFLVWVVIFKLWWEPNIGGEVMPDPAWVVDAVRSVDNADVGELIRGFLLWVNEAGMALPGLVISFCQVMVLLSVAVALATRLPMIVNFSVCVLVYFLGNLTPIMTAVSRQRNALIHFVAQLFETLLPGLDLFDVGNAIVRDIALDPLDYGVYTLSVAFYAVLYTTIALLFGLILFEDRDLA